ncbi:expressed unknown protein [Seminavis robusta]|uniref:Uncharacterized protein n=1 Tax=Seminavis robusta TaxID=568900 RepID=A0A9N8HLJ0_9STRA|nr:expressed unknown protein [Seminavis robusta]|eukprot:Sro920_g220300.1 n/a (279) ;mRNA; r:33701-34537
MMERQAQRTTGGDNRLGIDDPRRMDLSPQEKRHAMAIKQAIEGTAEIDNLSDFFYCQFALIEGSNVEGALERAKHLQAFREEYKIMETKDHGYQVLEAFIQLSPQHFLSYEFQDNSYTMILNLKGLQPKTYLSTPKTFGTWITGFYYMHHCFCPDFETIRQGVSFYAECHGYDSSLHVNLKFAMRVCAECMTVYPFRLRKAHHFHTSIMCNLMVAAIKRVMPASLGTNKIKVGCQAPMYLDEIYLSPSVEASNQKTLQRWKAALAKRYRNEHTFSLLP